MGWSRDLCIQLASIHFIAASRKTIYNGGGTWGCSSAGRAPDLHSGGRRFDPDQLHQREFLPGGRKMGL